MESEVMALLYRAKRGAGFIICSWMKRCLSMVGLCRWEVSVCRNQEGEHYCLHMLDFTSSKSPIVSVLGPEEGFPISLDLPCGRLCHSYGTEVHGSLTSHYVNNKYPLSTSSIAQTQCLIKLGKKQSVLLNKCMRIGKITSDYSCHLI